MKNLYNNNMYFDWKHYIFLNKDLKQRGINTKENAVNHYLNYGIKENRLVNTYLVLYSYYETEIALNNLKFFIKNGLVINNDVHYVFIINGNKYTKIIPNNNNITILTRENKGHDFAAWSFGLSKINYNNYNKFILMNDTVCGPYIPRYIPNNLNWYKMFTNLLSDKIKLSGLTINYYPWDNTYYSKHVQSMIYCTDKIGLDLLIKNNILLNRNDYYNKYYDNTDSLKKEYVIKFEFGLSKVILDNNYDIAALYSSDIIKDKTGDVWFNNKYNDDNINPFETMFIKTNRIHSKLISYYYKCYM
jgi:hypothetical protein